MGSSHSKPSRQPKPKKAQKPMKAAKPTKTTKAPRTPKMPKTPKPSKKVKPPVPAMVWSDKAISKATGLPKKPLKQYIHTPHHQPLPAGARPKQTQPSMSNSSKAYAAQVQHYGSKPLPPLPPVNAKKTKPQLKVAVPRAAPARPIPPRPANYVNNLISPSFVPSYIAPQPVRAPARPAPTAPADRRPEVSSFGKPSKSTTTHYVNANVFLAAPSSGFGSRIDSGTLTAQGMTHCASCNKRINAEKDYLVLHNVDTCRAIYHSHCAKKWLSNFQNPRNDRVSRPHCMRCHGGMNVQPCQVNKANPMGFVSYRG